MFKKTFLVSTAAILISFLASCSLVNSLDNSGSVTLTLSRSAARNADSDLETLYVDVSLKGDYSQTQTISLTSESQKATVNFDQIKPNASIYIEANAYIKEPGLNEKYILYKGVSNSIKVKPGENNISLSLKKLYTVWFELNGGTGDFDEQRVVSGEKATRPETEPTKEATDDYAYEFIGWYTSDDALFNFDTPIKQDTILYAKWAQKSFVTVTFDSNNGKDEEPFTTVRIVEGKTVKEPENHPEKEGTDEFAYEFSGWYTSADAKTQFDFTTPIDKDITLYAGWITKQWFTVTFDSDNGAVAAFATKKVLEGDKVSAPETNPTKADTDDEKYKFDGWYTTEGTAFDFNTEITDNITLIAHYAVTHIYKVSFNLNGGEGTFETQRITEGEKATRPSTEPTRENTATAEYTFGGWYTSTDNGETISDEPFDFDTPITGNLTLYAFWNSTEKFTVSFNVNGGTGNFESQNVTNGEKATEPTTQPTKEGDENTKYTFTGWYTSSDEGKTLSETPFNFAKTKITKDTVLYAGWKVKVAGGLDIELPIAEYEYITVLGPVYNADNESFTFTAEEGFDTYLWKYDGSEAGSSNTFTTPALTLPGVYDVILLATKTVNGQKKYYFYHNQIKYNMD